MRSGYSKKSGRRDYLISFVYLAVFLVITIVVAFIAIKPVGELVHKIEAVVPMQTRDIVLNDDTYNPLSVQSIDDVSYSYGDKIANISSLDFGLNTSVYYGSNRFSMGSGVGFSGESSPLGCEDTSFLVGYLEGELSSLRHCSEGDTLCVVTNYGEFRYRVTDIEYIDENEEAYSDSDDDRLVLCALTSDFSSHSKERLYVFADRIEGEVN